MQKIRITVFLLISCFLGNIALASTQSEIELGSKLAKDVEQSIGLSENAELQARVAKIGERLVKVADRKLPYTFKVLKINEINAFALPGGYIFLFEGLTDYLKTDDELAAIIGHEMGHAQMSHAEKQNQKNMELALLSMALFGPAGILLQLTTVDAIMAGYSRKHEFEADKIGFTLSTKAGFSPYAMLVTMERMKDYSMKRRERLLEHNKKETIITKKEDFDWFDSHPGNDSRIKAIDEEMKKMGVRYMVTEAEDGTATVSLGEWALPKFLNTIDDYKPLYRAQLATGKLCLLDRLQNFNADLLMLDKSGENMLIFYDEMLLLSLTPLDASSHQKSLDLLANDYLEALRKKPK